MRINRNALVLCSDSLQTNTGNKQCIPTVVSWFHAAVATISCIRIGLAAITSLTANWTTLAIILKQGYCKQVDSPKLHSIQIIHLGRTKRRSVPHCKVDCRLRNCNPNISQIACVLHCLSRIHERDVRTIRYAQKCRFAMEVSDGRSSFAQRVILSGIAMLQPIIQIHGNAQETRSKDTVG